MKNWEFLKKIEESGLRRSELAFEIERSVSYVSAIATNRVNLTEEEKVRVARALKCKVEQIF